MAQADSKEETPLEAESNDKPLLQQPTATTDEYLLDMVFVLDCTGSMASYINSARDNIVKVSEELSKISNNKNKNETDTDDSKTESKDDSNSNPSKALSCKFAVVAYRDHPPQSHSFITKIRSFTGDSTMIKQFLSTLSADGGGDGPECLGSALYDVLYNLCYRNNSQRIIIVITDAPPHGLDTDYDGFPNGDPYPIWKLKRTKSSNNRKRDKYNKYNNNNSVQSRILGVKTREQSSGEYDETSKKELIMPDILEIARKISDDLQASFYTVACEPGLSTSYDYARDLMEAMAEMSNGKYLPLASANLLPKVIIGSVKQQMLIDELTEQIGKEIEQLKLEYKSKGKEKELTKDVIVDFVERKWQNSNITYKEVEIGTLYRKERGRTNIELLLNRKECKNLKDFGKKCKRLPRLSRQDFRHLETSKSSSKTSTGTRLVERSVHLSSSSKMFATKSVKKLDGGSSRSSHVYTGTSSVVGTMHKHRSKLSEMDEMAVITTDRKKDKKKGKKKKGGIGGKGGDMVLTTRWGDEDASASEDEQDVYEQVRRMDTRGVTKVVQRYMQTH